MLLCTIQQNTAMVLSTVVSCTASSIHPGHRKSTYQLRNRSEHGPNCLYLLLTNPPPPPKKKKHQNKLADPIICIVLKSQKQKSAWRLKNNGHDPPKDQINSLDRRTQTTIFHLHTGHCGLRKHLKRLDPADSPL